VKSSKLNEHKTDLISAKVVVLDDRRVGEVVRERNALNTVNDHHLLGALLNHKAVDGVTRPISRYQE